MSDFDSLFDKIGSAAKRAADSVSANVSIAAEEQKIREASQAIGKLYYKAKRGGKELDGPDFADQCRRIDACLKRIDELKSRKDVAGYAYDEDFVDVDIVKDDD